MKFTLLLALSLGLSLSLTACDGATNPTTTTDSTKTPTATAWTATVTLNPIQLTTTQLNATASIQATASQNSTSVSTKSAASVTDIISLAIPSGESCVVTVNGYDASKTVIWTGSVAVAKSLPAAVITLNSAGGTIVPGDETPISYRSVQTAGAQSASPGSFISVRGDAESPNGFILTSGTYTAAEEAALDLVFFAMTNGVKDAAKGTPTFMSPNSIKSTLNWGTKNKTIIVKATGTEASFTTVQSVKDAIGSSTSESAPVVSGGVYALQLSNGKYAVLSVTSLAGANGSAVVDFRILNTGAASTSGSGTTNPTGDQTSISFKSTLDAGAQQAATGSFISVRGDAIDPGGFIMNAGDMSSEEEAVMDLCFFAMTGNAKDSKGTPSIVSPNLIKSTLSWSTINKTIIVPATAMSESDFSTVQDIKDVIGSSTSEVAQVVDGGVYALKLSNGKYAILSVTNLTGSAGAATVSFKIIR